jgi:hypothetical protein
MALPASLLKSRWVLQAQMDYQLPLLAGLFALSGVTMSFTRAELLSPNTF